MPSMDSVMFENHSKRLLTAPIQNVRHPHISMPAAKANIVNQSLFDHFKIKPVIDCPTIPGRLATLFDIPTNTPACSEDKSRKLLQTPADIKPPIAIVIAKTIAHGYKLLSFLSTVVASLASKPTHRNRCPTHRYCIYNPPHSKSRKA